MTTRPLLFDSPFLLGFDSEAFAFDQMKQFPSVGNIQNGFPQLCAEIDVVENI